jgi:hypothetical protein
MGADTAGVVGADILNTLIQTRNFICLYPWKLGFERREIEINTLEYKEYITF